MRYLQKSCQSVNWAIQIRCYGISLLRLSYFSIYFCLLGFLALCRALPITFVVGMWGNEDVDDLDPLSVRWPLVLITADFPRLVGVPMATVTGQVISETNRFLRSPLTVPSLDWLGVQLHYDVLLRPSRAVWLLILLEIGIGVIGAAPYRLMWVSLWWRAADAAHGWHECWVFILIQDCFPEGGVLTFV